MKIVSERFLAYASIDTQSDESSQTTPSTKKQFDLAGLLVRELKDIGLEEVEMDEHGYIMATLPANTDKKIPVIGFISHMDTSPDMSGENVKPQIVRNYDGKDIILKGNETIVLSPDDFPELLAYRGQDLITTDGTTLLGADDKAGIAEIMTSMEFLHGHPEIKHGKIRIAFTVDEEIGRGADKFDVKKFGADYAYTLDGGRIGELEYENFNAALATIHVQGRNVHPGTAKDTMINAIHLAMEFNGLLPVQQRPEFTQGYEGFFHLIDFSGQVEQATFRYIVRDHDREKFEIKKKMIMDCAGFMNKKYGEGRVRVELKDQYYNMHEKVAPVKFIVDIAEEAMIELGIQPVIKPIRGGTDGSKLSYMGLPCPNIFAGGHNFHGKYEYIPIQSMEKAVEVIVKIAELYEKKDW
ncbi:MAG: peptidase T [Cyclobacteriaceae bacterium]|nr:peptidase T [Cyclobacteriaceae bacterium]